jgi:hypothetical protein
MADGEKAKEAVWRWRLVPIEKDNSPIGKQAKAHVKDNAKETDATAKKLIGIIDDGIKHAKEKGEVVERLGSEMNEYWISGQVAVGRLNMPDKDKDELVNEIHESMLKLQDAAAMGDRHPKELEAAKEDVRGAVALLKLTERKVGKMSEADYVKWRDTPVETPGSKTSERDLGGLTPMPPPQAKQPTPSEQKQRK